MYGQVVSHVIAPDTLVDCKRTRRYLLANNPARSDRTTRFRRVSARMPYGDMCVLKQDLVVVDVDRHYDCGTVLVFEP
jgi:hypothetical protein